LEYLEINLQRCTVFLTAAEINRLLQQDPELFRMALKRGKAFKRANSLKERTEAKKSAGRA
jgi:hypothetical protein